MSKEYHQNVLFTDLLVHLVKNRFIQCWINPWGEQPWTAIILPDKSCFCDTHVIWEASPVWLMWEEKWSRSQFLWTCMAMSDTKSYGSQKCLKDTCTNVMFIPKEIWDQIPQSCLRQILCQSNLYMCTTEILFVSHNSYGNVRCKIYIPIWSRTL